MHPPRSEQSPSQKPTSDRSTSVGLIILLAATIAITPLAIDMYLPAMPTIAQDLQAHIGTVQQSLSIFLAAYGAGMLLFGPLADKFGRRPLALLGISGFAIASFLLVWANSIEWFLIMRAVQAFCGAAATVVVPGIIRHLYKEHTAKGMSYMSLIMMLAPLLAPSIGSGILYFSEWHTIFWVLFGYSAILLFFIWKYLPEPATTNSRESMSFFSGYKTVFAQRSVRPLIGTIIFSSFSFFCYLTAIPFVYIQYFGVSEQLFSLLFAINISTLMLSNFINSRFVSRCGSPYMVRKALFTGIVLAALLCTVNIFKWDMVYTVILLAPLLGCLTMITTNTDAMILLKFPDHSGTATAVTGTLRYACGALAGPVLALTYTGTPVPFAALMLAGVISIAFCQLLLTKSVSKTI
jgi:DHA1 family bicyclomycin/chloramphenicol resistance-like MFS transporter